MKENRNLDNIKAVCISDDLAGYDPYDIWMTGIGIQIKSLFNKNKYVGLLPAAALTLYDHFINNNARLFYKKREYPTARAMAALTLFNIYKIEKKDEYLEFGKRHVDWLIEHSCKGYAGLCWGLGFKWAVGEGLDYNENTPFSTHTPYALEAIHAYIQITNDSEYIQHIESIFTFYENDIKVLFEDSDEMATSYGPAKDRLVTNAVSYTMYAYAIFLGYFPDKKEIIKKRIGKLYNFIKNSQRNDGSWLYSPEDKNSFIDCFHSCFVLKNIYKTHKILPLKDAQKTMAMGYDYLKLNFYDSKDGLFKRFSLSNKPSIIKYDLYDNAEFLHFAVLFGDHDFAKKLATSIGVKFRKGDDIYSVIDTFNFRKNKNTLRWAKMPYLYALSALELDYHG
ncbi:hypothetical protein DZC72_09415 [Maribacter algicola]|uniref:Delta-aminolevulinic acid dehydratase n=1 Tax=Maribacter algicola TaxID=2498892 RepID=A0A3R8PWF0_9FLAO|nr:hypothetical protein [Maribacter algicola]RRQ47955.1 hypothetical protein DZC72_09415 [Maribacter algicola]